MSRPILISSACLALSLLISNACEPVDQCENNANIDRNTIFFSVGAQGVSYLYHHPTRGFHHAATLDEVPLPHRAAVVVVTAEHGKPSFDQSHFPVADLVGEQTGAEVTATWMSRQELLEINRTSLLGHERARQLRFWAQEVSQLSPNSERARSSDRALRLLEETIEASEERGETREEETQ